ncbi:RICIN domain-containing protein [Streptomyces sp. NPDC054956]
MSRPGRPPGPLKGRTDEANALAQFLRDLTAEYTVSQLEQRYEGSRSVWSEYRSGQKIIPLSRLKRVVEDRFARDARTREQKLQEARRLHLAAANAAAAAGTASAPVAEPVPVVEEVPGTGSGAQQDVDGRLAGGAAGWGEVTELSADNPLTSADEGPGSAADVPSESKSVSESETRPDVGETVVSRSVAGPGPRAGGRSERLRRWRTPAQWGALAVLVAVLVIANRPDHAKDPAAEASSPQSIGQESAGPEEQPSPTAVQTPQASASPSDTPTPSEPAPSPSESAVKPSAKPPAAPAPAPEKSKAPEPAPPPPVVGNGPRTFVNAATQMCLEIRRSSGADGATANQWTCNNSSSQKWLITNPTGSTNIVSLDSRKCLEIRGDVGDDGATANQWSCNNAPSTQVWVFRPVAGGGWNIVNATGKCLTIRGQGDGALASQWPCDNSRNQTWE